MLDRPSIPPTAAAASAAADAYAPYGQLAKMVLPACGSIALYDGADELLWCSDAFERPDLRGLLDELATADAGERGCVELESGGTRAFVALLRGDGGRRLGALVVELPSADRPRYNVSMAASLLKPVLDCLASRITLEQTVLRGQNGQHGANGQHAMNGQCAPALSGADAASRAAAPNGAAAHDDGHAETSPHAEGAAGAGAPAVNGAHGPAQASNGAHRGANGTQAPNGAPAQHAEAASAPAAAPADAPDSRSIELLLSVDEFGRDDATALEELIRRSVIELGAAFGALLVPEKRLAVTAAADAHVQSASVLERTRKHLLAWAELNNRPMIVNKVGASGHAAPFKILACPLRDPEGRVIGLIALFRASKAPDFELRDVRIFEFVGRKAIGILASRHDPLTGLVNRLIFERRAQALVDAAPAGGAPHTLLYIDIDRLQAVNDAFGFGAGDEVIRRCAEILRTTPEALATRLDGDRFAVLLPPGADADAERRTREIGAAMAELEFTNGETTVAVGASVGATPVAAGTRIAHALAAAELACKRAKQQGRNRVEWNGDVEIAALAGKRRTIDASSLQNAIKANQFRLDAQPVMGLRTRRGETIGYELLVRMQGPSGEELAPDKFFDAAERYELLPALDRWVLSSALEALKGARAEIARAPYAFMINVSAQTVAAGGFPEFALEQIEAAGLPAEAFCFEIGEAAAVRQLAAAETFVRTLADAGCKLALDDFGCGLSSLAHLKRLPVHYLKVDGRFARRVRDDRIAESIVSGIAKAARTLGVGVIAEHVESEALAERLEELDVDFGQGFHFGRPRPLAELVAAFEPDAAAAGRCKASA